ncbi:MAG: sulfotransferase [Rhizobiales bacterium]|nr:sulfotransferase [Hyphomicrobiales bacterium]MBI3674009.1 sulfotransferase [Hyphomicrobiales bacterium]
MTSLAKPNVRASLDVVDQAMAAGLFGRAETIARHLQSAYPRRADANDVLGRVMLARGKYDLAIDYCRRAVEAERNNPVYLVNLGRGLLHSGLVTEAEPLMARALEIDPRQYQAVRSLGTFYHHAGHGERAAGLFRKALELAPPAARTFIHIELMECLLSIGRKDEVRAAVAAKLSAGGLLTRHQAKYVAILASLGKFGADSAEFAMVETTLQRPDVPPHERSNLMIRKGLMFEASGRFDEAFETIAAAKRLLTPAARLDAFAKDVDERIATFSPERVARLAERFGSATEGHVFVIGLPRTGTTLVEQIVGRHSQVGGMGELETMTYLAAQMRNGLPLAEIEAALESHGRQKLASYAAIYDGVAEFLAPGKPLHVDKMPHNFRYIGEIAILFPKARFVHCRRHPADSFLSAFQNEMSETHSYSYDPRNYASYYAAYRRLMRHMYEVAGGRIHAVDYETLTAAPRPAIESLLRFLGLDWQEACLNPQDAGATVRTFSQLQVRNAINTSSVGRWRNYESRLAPLAALAD